jgi:transcriptional repressor NrdR
LCKNVCYYTKYCGKIISLQGEKQMKCIYCQCEESKVLDSRSTDETNSIRRRRECLGCGKRFTTYETIETVPILVIKKDGSRQPFNIEKVKSGMIKACEKRPVSMAQIDTMASEIEKQIQNSLRQEIPSQQIGEMIMEKLKPVDEIAYVRFASVYRQFKDVTNFIKLITEM